MRPKPNLHRPKQNQLNSDQKIELKSKRKTDGKEV